MLEPFAKEEVGQMVTDTMGVADAAELVDIIFDNSEGMPAYLTEVMQIMR